MAPEPKRLSRSERYKRKIKWMQLSLANHERTIADLLAILDGLALELSSEQHSTIRNAVTEIRRHTETEA